MLLAITPPSPTRGLDFDFVKISETGMCAPGGGTFSGFSSASLDGKGVTFSTREAGSFEDGIFAYINGTLTRVADENTAIPGSIGTFGSFNAPSIDDGAVAFRARGSSEDGIYSTASGVLARVADTSIELPFESQDFDSFIGPITSFNPNVAIPSLDGGHVTFYGSGNAGGTGVYSDLPGGPNFDSAFDLSQVVDNKILMPGALESYADFGHRPSAVGSVVAFLAEGTSGRAPLYHR